MAGDMPAAFERIGEGEGFRVGLHLSAIIERPRATMTEGRPAWPAGGVKVPVDEGGLAIMAKHALGYDATLNAQ
jgi:hypothetical protein